MHCFSTQYTVCLCPNCVVKYREKSFCNMMGDGGMKLQDLLQNTDIDLSKTRLVRHNISNNFVAHNYSHGYLDIYQSIQTPKRFRGSENIISFLGVEGTEGIFVGCYKIIEPVALSTVKLPEDFLLEDYPSDDTHVFWRMEKMDILSELIDRLTIDWGKSTLSWCQKATLEKEVLYILPAVSDIQFISYERVLLPFDKLQTIVLNCKSYKTWEDKLSAVAGVYLITDTKTGKHYVGSASGEQGGIWGRWSEYARTKHGGNKRLKELITADSDYCRHFQFSILEVFPIKRNRHEILEYEQLYKRKLRTIAFGWNDN